MNSHDESEKKEAARTADAQVAQAASSMLTMFTSQWHGAHGPQTRKSKRMHQAPASTNRADKRTATRKSAEKHRALHVVIQSQTSVASLLLIIAKKLKRLTNTSLLKGTGCPASKYRHSSLSSMVGPQSMSNNSGVKCIRHRTRHLASSDLDALEWVSW